MNNPGQRRSLASALALALELAFAFASPYPLSFQQILPEIVSMLTGLIRNVGAGKA